MVPAHQIEHGQTLSGALHIEYLARTQPASPETFHEWGHDRSTVTAENAGALVHLRVELQFMARLPRSNGLMFSIRTYLISLNELVTNPAWAKRLHRVLRDLPAPIADYKGMTRYRQPLLEWLSQFDPHA